MAEEQNAPAQQADDPIEQLNQELAQTGLRDVNAGNVTQKYTDALRLASDKGREASEAKTKLEQYTPLIDKIENDPQFRAGMSEWYEQNYMGGQGSQQYGQQYNQPQPGAMDSQMAAAMGDQTAREISELRKEQTRIRMQREFDDLKERYGDIIDDNVRQRVVNECIANDNYGNGAVKGAFMSIYGDQLIEQSQERAKQQVLKDMQANNNSYPNPSTVSPVSPGSMLPADAPEYGTTEYDDWSLKQVEDILRNPGKAKEIADSL